MAGLQIKLVAAAANGRTRMPRRVTIVPSCTRLPPFDIDHTRVCLMRQSRAMSMIEAVSNVVVGYALAIATQIVVFPWFGIKTGLAEHLTIGLAFVGVSLVRGYVLRRLFEAIRSNGKGC